MHKNYDANMGEYECIEDIEVNMKDSIMLLFLGIYKGNNHLKRITSTKIVLCIKEFRQQMLRSGVYMIVLRRMAIL